MARVCSFTVMMAVIASLVALTNAQQKPNIIMIVADDLGWSDPERHDSLMRTPTLTKMAERGVFLNQSYVQPTCAPTRSSLLTGRYAYTIGMQKNEIEGSALAWLNETLVLLPTEMRKIGYSTHALGKWHLGFCDWELVPTRRGFDTFYGFLSGTEGYFSHQGGSSDSYDFWDNEKIDFSAKGIYSTELFTTRAQEIIQGRDRSESQPFFMYLAYQNVHAPFEVKFIYIEKYCSHVTNETRRIHCAMAAAMDEGIGNITATLDAKGLTNNTIILFLSDNGGPVFDGSVNYPLRGGKASIWEGGTRSFTILNAPGLRNTNTTWPGMINAIDWFPTLLQAAGGTRPDYVDGIAMWNQIIDNADSLRDEFIYNINDSWGTKGLRWKNWKLIQGPPGRKNGWYPPYQLLDQGHPWEDIDKKAWNENDWHLYDLAVDPNERVNVIDRPENAKTVTVMKSKLAKYMERLQPYKEAPKTKAFNKLTKALGYWAPGWCNITLPSSTTL